MSLADLDEEVDAHTQAGHRLQHVERGAVLVRGPAPRWGHEERVHTECARHFEEVAADQVDLQSSAETNTEKQMRTLDEIRREQPQVSTHNDEVYKQWPWLDAWF